MKLVRKIYDLKSYGSLAAALAIAFVLSLFTGTTVSAQAALANTGVDPAEYVTLALTALGGVVAVIVGGYFAFLLIKKAMKWGNKIA